jgi:hypothetical protein
MHPEETLAVHTVTAKPCRVAGCEQIQSMASVRRSFTSSGVVAIDQPLCTSSVMLRALQEQKEDGPTQVLVVET